MIFDYHADLRAVSRELAGVTVSAKQACIELAAWLIVFLVAGCLAGIAHGMLVSL